MKRLLLLLLPVALFAGQARYARLGEFEGKVEVQLHPGDPWIAAERNLPLTESAWLRTGASSRLEIEFDEGSAWRLGPESQIEISDYSRLSTGQHFTVLSLDRGVAYFTGEPGSADTLMLVTPGAHVTLLRGARVRLQVDATASRISVIEGVVRLSCPAAELDLREGQTVRVDPANTARFWLDREVPTMDLDRWNEDRDKALAASSSGSHVSQRYGVVDLDGAGEWVQTELGAVWKPKVAEGWAPFQNGRWRWYDAVGYTWVSDEVGAGFLIITAAGRARATSVGYGYQPRRLSSSQATFTGSTTRNSPGGVRWLQPKTGSPRLPRSSSSTSIRLTPVSTRTRAPSIRRASRIAEGTARRSGLRPGAAFAGLPGIAPGSHATAAAGGRNAPESRGPRNHFPGQQPRHQ